MYRHEQDEQIATEGVGDGLGRCAECSSEVQSQVQPEKITQHQLFACLVLKAFLKTDYRGLAAHLPDCPALCKAIELTKVPHYTTFQKAVRQLLRAGPVSGLLDDTVHCMMGRKRKVPLAAIDSTGLESRHVSRYFIKSQSRESNHRFCREQHGIRSLIPPKHGRPPGQTGERPL